MNYIAKELRINEQIRVRQVRLIGADGEQVGIVETRDALKRAQDEDLDLVMVGEQANPPVAKLLDYGKYRYELQQQAKEARKRSRQQEMKAIKFRVKIDEHDYQTKVNHVKRFLKGGHKVRVVIMFRGRERTHPELGQDILNRVAQDTSEIAIIESAPSLAGMDMNMTLGPNKETMKASLKDDAKADSKGENDSKDDGKKPKKPSKSASKLEPEKGVDEQAAP